MCVVNIGEGEVTSGESYQSVLISRICDVGGRWCVIGSSDCYGDYYRVSIAIGISSGCGDSLCNLVTTIENIQIVVRIIGSIDPHAAGLGEGPGAVGVGQCLVVTAIGAPDTCPGWRAAIWVRYDECVCYCATSILGVGSCVVAIGNLRIVVGCNNGGCRSGARWNDVGCSAVGGSSVVSQLGDGDDPSAFGRALVSVLVGDAVH